MFRMLFIASMVNLSWFIAKLLVNLPLILIVAGLVWFFW